jgi:hypothetical protein
VKTAHALATAATASPSCNESLTKTLPRSWVARLFLKLNLAYGRLWTAHIDGIEEQAVDEWAKALADLSAEQLRHGLSRLETAHPKYPPTLFEFRGLCLKRGVNEHGLTFVPEYYRETRHERLLDAPRDEEAAARHIAAMRAALGGVR